MIVNRCLCNLCHGEIQATLVDGLIGGVTLNNVAPVAHPPQFEISTDVEDGAHICHRCWNGLKPLFIK